MGAVPAPILARRPPNSPGWMDCANPDLAAQKGGNAGARRAWQGCRKLDPLEPDLRHGLRHPDFCSHWDTAADRSCAPRRDLPNHRGYQGREWRSVAVPAVDQVLEVATYRTSG